MRTKADSLADALGDVVYVPRSKVKHKLRYYAGQFCFGALWKTSHTRDVEDPMGMYTKIGAMLGPFVWTASWRPAYKVVYGKIPADAGGYDMDANVKAH